MRHCQHQVGGTERDSKCSPVFKRGPKGEGIYSQKRAPASYKRLRLPKNGGIMGVGGLGALGLVVVKMYSHELCEGSMQEK